jgi:Xaa-Pro dipeptidase
VPLFLNKSVVIIKKYYCYNNFGDTVSHNGILKMIQERLDVPPMIFTGNPLIIKPGMVFFMHMILMDSEAQLAMNLGETYLVTETGNERLGKQKLDLVVL